MKYGVDKLTDGQSENMMPSPPMVGESNKEVVIQNNCVVTGYN